MISSSDNRWAWVGALACVIGLMGCERVIDLDVGENPRLPVFSFRMDAATGAVVGTVSTSVDFFSPGIPPAEVGVTGWLTDSAGGEWPVAELVAGSGVYSAETGRAWVPGERCALALEWEGQTYETQVLVPEAAAIDSLELRRFEGFFGIEPDPDTSWQIFVHLPAFPAVRNILLEYWVDGVYQTEVTQVFKTTPDAATEVPLGWNQRLFSPGEEVEVWLWSLSDASFAYWQAVGDLSGFGGPGGVPGNPPNHWSLPALGHFTVAPLTQTSVLVPQ